MIILLHGLHNCHVLLLLLDTPAVLLCSAGLFPLHGLDVNFIHEDFCAICNAIIRKCVVCIVQLGGEGVALS